MLEPDTQIVPPRGSNHAVEARPERPNPDARTDVREDPVVLRRWVGRYELIHRLAHGGMATVYLGRAKGKAGFEKIVAVKVIHPHLAGEAEFVGMFLDEARIAARIHHPHVVEILDLGETDGAYFMVMEFIEGENLSALTRALEGERLPIAVTLQIIADTLEGLCAAHELRDGDGQPYKLVHRDVSPHNILINLDGWAKVGDFGIMKAAGKSSNTKTGELRGKLAYMSPEQARGAAVDHRTDLFAVGVIAWELLTGKRLFACATEAATLEKVMACEVPRLDHERVDDSLDHPLDHPELLESLQTFLDRALASDPSRRPTDAAAMLGEVKRLLRMVDERGDGEEPRAYLGALMRRFFRRRVEYARAALRRSTEHEGQAREWLVEPTVQVGRSPTGPNGIVERTPTGPRAQSGSGPIPSEVPQTGSNPALSNSHPQLSMVRPSPLAQWSMWLLLPMLGAGIAIAAMLLFGPGFGRQVDQPASPGEQPEPAPVPSETAPASLAATEYQPVAQRPKPPGEVRWFFSTTPRGARVLINGEVTGDPTPTWVYLPVDDELLDIRIELDGYEPHTLQLPAVHDQTFSESLEPLAKPAQSKPNKRARKSTKVHAPQTGETGPEPGGAGTGFLPVPDSLRDGGGK